MIVSRKVLADVLKVDIRSLKNFVDDGMPKEARGRYDLTHCVPWYVEREREAARAGKGLNDLDLARQRKTLAEARKAEIELDEIEKNMIPLSVHEERLEVMTGRLAVPVKGLDRYIADVQRATTMLEAKGVLDRVSDDLLRALQGIADETDELIEVPEDDASAIA